MGYENMLFLSPHTLSCKDKCIVVDEEKVSPLEDINMIILENRESQLSSYVLSELSKYNITCIFCDEKHMPCNILLPVSGNVRHTARLQKQFSLKVTAKKDIWKNIIIKKVTNQAKCLSFYNAEEYTKLLSYAKRVKTNDNTFIESQAARIYFTALYGKNFLRREDTIINAALNYGYAIIRSIIARSIVAYGFEPSIGIFHCNTFNPFNLVDDFMEPYRPLIDKAVKDMIINGSLQGDKLTTLNKQELIQIQNQYVFLNHEKVEVRDSINKMIMSFIQCCENNVSVIAVPDCFYE